MNRVNFNIFENSKEKEKRLFENALIIMDSSALLDFYYYPIEMRNDIYEKVIPLFEGRLWIAAHAEFEYLKNRVAVIEKAIKEKYEPLSATDLPKIKNHINQFDSTLKQFKKDTLKSDKHPFLDQTKIDELIASTQTLIAQQIDFQTKMAELIKAKKDEILSLKNAAEDDVLKKFEEVLKVGPPLTYVEQTKIIEEGKLRYIVKIPPGYEDQKKKIGTQIFGDLFIWKQLIEIAKSEDKDVIFITNDLKEDWCYIDKRNRISKPREELIKEFNDSCGKEFWMYNQAQFVYLSKKIFNSDFEDSKIEEISKLVTERNESELVFKCGNCNGRNSIYISELNLDFDAVDGHDGAMGSGTHYGSIEELSCGNCGEDCTVTLEIWESCWCT